MRTTRVTAAWPRAGFVARVRAVPEIFGLRPSVVSTVVTQLAGEQRDALEVFRRRRRPHQRAKSVERGRIVAGLPRVDRPQPSRSAETARLCGACGADWGRRRLGRRVCASETHDATAAEVDGHQERTVRQARE